MPPNVVVRLHYYDKNAAKRSFYNGTQKDDYLGYVDKGIQSVEKIDYVDYIGDDEKSSGVFGKDGLLSKEDKKVLREKLRSTESCIWDMVISFTEKFGEKNLFNYGQAQALIEKTFPKFLKQAGMTPDNITWYAGMHTNTDNRHIHLSFFENEPQRFNQNSKSLVYRFGKINMAAVNSFKIEIEKHFLSPVEGMKRVRKQLLDEAKTAINQPCSGYAKAVKSLVKKLYGQIPYEGTIAYGSENTASCRDTVDSITTCILKSGLSSEDYLTLSSRLTVRDCKIRNICESHKIDSPEKYLLADKFQADLYRRMGNVIIKEVLKLRKAELLKAKEIRHAKVRQKLRQDSLLYLLERSVQIAALADMEVLECFKEFLEKLELAQIERQLEQAEM